MKMLLLIAHGSRREASNQEVREIARRLEAVSAGSCAAVMPAFLELAEPSIQDGVRLCSEAGATEVTVIPYFLSAGRHVAEDIPRELEEASRQHPQLHIQLREHIGAHREMPQLLLKSALGEQPAG